MSAIPCRACDHPAPYSHSDRRGDVHICPRCQTTTVYPTDQEGRR